MPDRIGNGLPNEVLGIEMKAAGHHHVGGLGREFAQHIPLGRQPFRKRPQIRGEFVQADLGCAAQGGDEGPQLALFLKHHLLEMVEIRLKIAAGNQVALECFQAKRSSSEELHDAVVQVPRKCQSRPRFGAFFDRSEVGVALDVTSNVGGDLAGQIDVVRRKVRNRFEKQFAPACTRSDRDRNSLG